MENYLKKIKSTTTAWSSKSRLGSKNWASKELRAGSQREICTLMFTAALITTAKRRKQPKCPLTVKWIEKIHTHRMADCSVITKNYIMPFAATWMDLEIITLNEISQTQTPYHLYVESKIRQNWIYLQNRKRLTDIENTLGLPRWEVGGRMAREFRISRRKLFHREWMNRSYWRAQGRALSSLGKPA